MTKVVAIMSMSLDGYIAAVIRTNGRMRAIGLAGVRARAPNESGRQWRLKYERRAADAASTRPRRPEQARSLASTLPRRPDTMEFRSCES